MLQIIKNRRAAARDNDKGFTLIELMVVVLIIAVLLAIAIPTFLGAQSKSKDRSAQSSVRNGLTAAKTIMADNGTYTAAIDTALDAVEPSVSFEPTGTPSTGPKVVSIDTSATTFYAVAKSDAGKCYSVKDVTTSGTTYASWSDAAGTPCTGTYAKNVAVVYGGSW